MAKKVKKGGGALRRPLLRKLVFLVLLVLLVGEITSQSVS